MPLPEPPAGPNPASERRLHSLLAPREPLAVVHEKEFAEWLLKDPLLQVRLNARLQAQAALATAQAATGVHSPQASAAGEALAAANHACRMAFFTRLLQQGHGLEALRQAYGDLVPSELGQAGSALEEA
jgi:hypothetical protein